MHFTKKRNNVETFVNLHIFQLTFFCRRLHKVFVQFYFLVKITAGKVSIVQ